MWGVALGSLTDLEKAAAVRTVAHKTPPPPSATTRFIPGLRKRRRNCSGDGGGDHRGQGPHHGRMGQVPRVHGCR